jgi:hypothetical protein
LNESEWRKTPHPNRLPFGVSRISVYWDIKSQDLIIGDRKIATFTNF